MNQLHLHVPFFDELWYRKQLMEDPATMNYNRGYELPVGRKTAFWSFSSHAINTKQQTHRAKRLPENPAQDFRAVLIFP